MLAHMYCLLKLLRLAPLALLATSLLPAASISGVYFTALPTLVGTGTVQASSFVTADGHAVKLQGVFEADCTALCTVEIAANFANSLGGGILLHYDFTFSHSTGNFARDWGFYDASSNVLASGAGDALGDVLIHPGFLRFTATSGDAFTLTVPGNSIDLSPSAVPEPTTVALSLTGLAVLAATRRRSLR